MRILVRDARPRKKIQWAHLVSPGPRIMGPSQHDRSPIMTQRLQNFINLLAGLAILVAGRLATDRASCTAGNRSYTAYEKPAYLRRRTRVVRGR